MLYPRYVFGARQYGGVVTKPGGTLHPHLNTVKDVADLACAIRVHILTDV